MIQVKSSVGADVDSDDKLILSGAVVNPTALRVWKMLAGIHPWSYHNATPTDLAEYIENFDQRQAQ